MLERLRGICLALPETSERPSHGAPSFFVREKKCFLMLLDDHHERRHLRRSGARRRPATRSSSIAADPARFFRPPYVGHRGWLGVRFNDGVDWDELVGIVEDAFATVAPKRLLDSRARRLTACSRLCAACVPKFEKDTFGGRRPDGTKRAVSSPRRSEPPMHRINLAASLLAAAVLARCALGARRHRERRRQPGLRGRRQRRRDVPERLRRAVQPRQLRRRPQRLDVQYASAASTSWSATPLSGSIQPGRHYLVQLASTAAVGAALAGARRDRHLEPRRVRRQGRARPRRDAACVRRGPRQLRGRGRSRGPRRLRVGGRLRGQPRPRPRSAARLAARPRRAEAAPTPTRTSPTSRPRRLRRATARPPRRRAPERRRRRRDRSGRRRRRACAVPLRRTRALEHQLRPGVRRADAAARSPSTSPSSATTPAGYVLTVHRTRVRSGRPAARHRPVRDRRARTDPRGARQPTSVLATGAAATAAVRATSWPAVRRLHERRCPVLPPGRYTSTVTFTVIGR